MMMLKFQNWLLDHLFLTTSFSSGDWKAYPDRRNRYILNILGDKEFIGKTMAEAEALFGANESYSLSKKRWSYVVKNKRNRKYCLVIYFNDGKVSNIRYVYKVIK